MSGSGNIAVLLATTRAPTISFAAWTGFRGAKLSNCQSGERSIDRSRIGGADMSACRQARETASRTPLPSGPFRRFRHSDKKLHIAGHTLKIYGRYMFFGQCERGSCSNDRRVVRTGLFEQMVAA
jgi:hypothetical protein